MEISVNLTPADWRAYVRHLSTSAMASMRRPWWTWPLVILAYFLITYVYLKAYGHIDWPTFGYAVALGVALRIEARQHNARLAGVLAPSDGGMLAGQIKYSITPEAVELEGVHFSSLLDWAGIRNVVNTGEHIALVMDNTAAWLIPVRDLADPEETLDRIKAMRPGS